MRHSNLIPVCLAFMFFGAQAIVAQNIAINDNGALPANAAMLDITSTTKGLLLPRVSLTNVNLYAPLTGTAVTSLLVYSSTAPTGGGGAGYYYWDGAKWVQLGSSAGTPWLTLGNAGTVDGTNFIGTTDNVPFNIRVNSTKAGRIDHLLSNTTFGYSSGQTLNSTTARNTLIGQNAGFWVGNTNGTDNTVVGYNIMNLGNPGSYNTSVGSESMYLSSASYNVAVGYQAMYSPLTVISGNFNTAVGVQSMYGNTTGGISGANNSALGYRTLYSNTTGTQNTAAGTNALYLNTTGNSNTAMGLSSMYNNTSGLENTAVGFQALNSNSLGDYNTAMGTQALMANTASSNTAFGAFALDANTSGINNTAVGYNALTNNVSGNHNTAVGIQSLNSNTGSLNTAMGRAAMRQNVGGSSNTAVGEQTMYSNVEGASNVAMGNNALQQSTYASQNTALGKDALYFQGNNGFNNTTTPWATDNVAVGYRALYTNQPTTNTNGYQNTAIGSFSMYSNTTGIRNIGAGMEALYFNTTGSNNTVMGYRALYNNGTAGYNVAIGTEALFNQSNSVVSVGYNTAVGYQSMYNTNAATLSSEGIQNTALGYNTLRGNTTASFNTAVGYVALMSNTTGQYNTALGYSAANVGGTHSQCTFLGANVSLTTIRSNVTMLGYGVTDGEVTGNNQVCVGNTAIAAGGLRAAVTGWTAYSDARFKTDVKEDVSGLDFIMKLRPVTYRVRPQELHKIWGTPDSLVRTIDFSEVQKETRIGFIAQDVERAMKESGFNFPGIDVPRNEKEVYTLRYVDFIMPMVKAIQEQQQMIKDQQKQIQELKAVVEKIASPGAGTAASKN